MLIIENFLSNKKSPFLSWILIEKFPEIHSIVHSIMQLASKCKQELDRNNGVELLKKVNKFTEIFWATKDVKTEKFVAPYPPELVIVCPVLKSV